MGDLSFKGFNDDGSVEIGYGIDEAHQGQGYATEAVGFDIDVAKVVCDRLGVTLVTQGIDWNEKEDRLNSGEIDCIWNGLSVTPARAEAMNLSEPYMKNELIAVVPGSSDVMKLSDLKGRNVGVQAGSTGQEVLEKSEFYSDVEVLIYNDMMTLLQELDQGNVDAALLDSVAAYYYIFSNEGQYFILADSLGEEEYAIAFRKKDEALRNRVQEIVSEMNADGTLGSISKKWFGSDITTVR